MSIQVKGNCEPVTQGAGESVGDGEGEPLAEVSGAGKAVAEVRVSPELS